MTNPKKRTAQLSKSEVAERLSSKRQRIDKAYKRLCEVRQRSINLGLDGDCVNKDIARVVEWANDVYVNRDSLNYRLKKDKKKVEEAAEAEAVAVALAAETETVTMIPNDVATSEANISTDSTSTPDPVANNTNTNTNTECNTARLICHSESPAGSSTSIDTNIPLVITVGHSSDNTISDVSTVSENIIPSVPKPVFTSGMSSKTKKQLAVTYAAELFQQAKANTKCTTSQVSNGTLGQIIDKVTKELQLESGVVNKWTVTSRVQSRNLTGINRRNISPLQDLEMIIAMVIIERSRQGATMTKDEIIEFVQAASKGTIHARKYNNFMKKERPNDLPLIEEVADIGLGWYEGFQKRHSNLLKKGNRLTVTDSKRADAIKRQNFVEMYDDVYNLLVRAGNARRLETEAMFDKDGNIVTDQELMYGQPTKYVLTHPNNFIFVDETGCNTNQKNDGYVGGQRFVVPADGTGAGLVGSTTDISFTVLAFTNAFGQPLLCAVIFPSKKDLNNIPLPWSLGIDRRKRIIGNPSNYEDLQRNIDEGQNMIGGPNCYVNGVTIPCYYGTSPKASITGEMLKKMLMHIDAHEVIDREDGRFPVLLCDGHHSRYTVPFLRYILTGNNLWKVIIGVPYGTHVWQVADSSEMNGCFKMALAKAKREYRDTVLNGNSAFCFSDIVPLLNMAWEQSFAKVGNGKKAVAERGWNPLNYALLRYHTFPDVVTEATTISDSFPNARHSNGVITITINVSDGPHAVVNKMYDTMKQDECFNAARMAKYEETNLEAQKVQTLKDLLSRDMRMSSGPLVAGRCAELVPEMLKRAVANETEKKRKEDKMITTMCERKQKQTEKFASAVRAYRKNPNVLTVADYTAIIKHFATAQDSPLKGTKKADMKAIYEKRDLATQMQFFCDQTVVVGQLAANNELAANNDEQHTL